jgi:AcrR family transcriptional regulator
MATADAQREKRRAILRAAVTVFARNGYHRSRVADVAREAGVAYGLVYHYFGSKEDLLETVFRRTWTRMLEAVEAVEAREQTARGQIEGVARIVLGAWHTDQDLVRLLVREVARSPQLGRDLDEISHAFAALERIVCNGQERGELRRDVEPRLAAWILYGALEEILTGWVFERLPDGPADIELAVQGVVSVLTSGLAAD